MIRKTLLASASLVAMTGMAAASCDDGWTAIGGDETLSAAIMDASPDARRDLRSFAETADRLHAAGYDEACEAIAEAIKDMAERRSIASAEPREERSPYLPTWEWESADLSERARTAEPFADHAMMVSSYELVNADVHMMDGDDIGAVDGFVTGENGGVSHVIVGYGGFLNIGDREVAVPVEKLRFDREDRIFFVEGDEAWFENQPDWDRAEWSETAWKRDMN